ncbi:HEM13 [Sanghuangporus vaninii]
MTSSKDERPMRERMAEYVLDLQERIVTALEGVDPASPKFKHDKWTRAQGGYGISCVFPPSTPSFEDEPKTVLEKGGVNVSVIHGRLPAAAVKQMCADHAAIRFDPDDPATATKTYPFFATGLSLVIHPRNPNAPTVHCNYRYFELGEPSSSPLSASQTEGAAAAAGPRGPLTGVPLAQKAMAWWFGGGADLTPSYLFPEDAVHFHRTLKTACDAHGSALFPAFKKWCDEYFFIAHRGEARGVGGIFFDDLSDAPHPRLSALGSSGEVESARPTTLEGVFAFVKACGDAFNPSYVPVLSRRHALPYTPAMRHWQLVRRGRYVEFNLVYDRGTKFGLMTPGARIESILMSLPETARWEYMSELGTQAETEEARLVSVLKTPKEWV